MVLLISFNDGLPFTLVENTMEMSWDFNSSKRRCILSHRRKSKHYRGSRQAAKYVATLGVGVKKNAVYLLRFKVSNF